MEKLNFELPAGPKSPGHRPSKLMTGLLVLIFLAVSANIIISLNPDGIISSERHGATLSADQQKKIALKLEQQGLYNASAHAWKKYIAKAGPDDKETALIWYRIGKLYQDNHAYEQALASYYRSENFFAVDSIASEISMRIQECLESMGKFSAMHHELADRVTIKQPDETSKAKDPVVAEIGTMKITASELDRRMETNIEQQMKMIAPYLPEEERNKQKESLLKQFSTPANRMMFLNQWVGEEILYRKAREGKLTQDPQIRDLLTDQERRLLARMTVEKEYENQIKITLSDLETYYEANKKEFMKEEKEQAFEDVKNEVYQALRSQKEQEVRQQLLNRLKDQYDVVIHQSAFAEKASSQTDTQTPKPQTGNKKTPSVQ